MPNYPLIDVYCASHVNGAVSAFYEICYHTIRDEFGAVEVALIGYGFPDNLPMKKVWAP